MATYVDDSATLDAIATALRLAGDLITESEALDLISRIIADTGRQVTNNV